MKTLSLRGVTTQTRFLQNVCSFCSRHGTLERRYHTLTLRHKPLSLLRNETSVRQISCAVFPRLSSVARDEISQRLSGTQIVLCRKYSERPPNNSDDGIKDPPAFVPVEDVVAQNARTLPVPVVIPDFFPNIPVVTISNSPVYPTFMKLIEVSIDQVQLFPFYGDIPINRYTIGAKHAYFVGFSSTSQNRKE